MVSFDPSRYPDGEHGFMYMPSPFSFTSGTRTHDWNHQKKKSGQNSSWTKPNKLDLILPLPDWKLNFVHHLSKYDQSRANKIYAGSNHTSDKNHHDSYHLNPSLGNRRYAAKMKKEGRRVVNSFLLANSKLHLEHPLSMKSIFFEPTVQASKQKMSSTLQV